MGHLLLALLVRGTSPRDMSSSLSVAMQHQHRLFAVVEGIVADTAGHKRQAVERRCDTNMHMHMRMQCC